MATCHFSKSYVCPNLFSVCRRGMLTSYVDSLTQRCHFGKESRREGYADNPMPTLLPITWGTSTTLIGTRPYIYIYTYTYIRRPLLVRGHQAARPRVGVTGQRSSNIKSVLVLTGHQSTDIIRSQVCQTGIL